MTIRKHQFIRGLGLISVLGNLALPITDGIGVLLSPGYDPLSHSVSDLALGPNGWIQGIGIYLGGIGVIAYALGLKLKLSRQWEVRLGEILIFLIGLCFLFSALFHTDPPGQATTLIGYIHGVASFFSAVFILPAFFLIALGLRDHKHLFIYTIVAGILQIILEIGRGRMPSDWVLFGLHERLVGINGVLWIIIISWVMLVRDRRMEP